MDFFEFTERWCRVHPEIQHVPGRKSPNSRFFLTTGFAEMVDFLIKNVEAKSSPCVVMESGAPLRGNIGGFDYKNYTLYFCVRALAELQNNDGPEAKACKQKAEELAHTFANNAVGMNKHWALRGISAHVEPRYEIQTTGPFHNWWYAAQLQISVGEGHDDCLGEELMEALINA